jgi:hypothetical protein
MWFPVESHILKENATEMVRLREAIIADHEEEGDKDKGKKWFTLSIIFKFIPYNKTLTA